MATDAQSAFQYVVPLPTKTRVCFWSSEEREFSKDVSRFGVANIFERNDEIYPGKYEIPSGICQLGPTSTKGTVIGGRTQPRETFSEKEWNITPSPAAYKIKLSAPPCAATFKTPKTRKVRNSDVTVGPGYFDVSMVPKRIKYKCSFGGRQIIAPPIHLKCGPFNLDICEKCKKTPEGDYWFFTPKLSEPEKTLSLCRACFILEKQRPQLFERTQLREFKKIRDCSRIHDHGGCEAKVYLQSVRDTAKIGQKEAYLSLYFS